MIEYKSDSPYANTQMYNNYLDVLEPRRIPFARDDVLHTLTVTHEYRPDLLAFDLYKNSNLWWVFQARNPNVFEDAVWDFRTGTKFYIPRKDRVEAALGI